jgi:hypothetical protein
MTGFSHITCKEKQENPTGLILQESCWRTVQWCRARHCKYWSTSSGRLRTNHFPCIIPATQMWRDTQWTCKMCANRDRFPQQERQTGCLWEFTARNVMAFLGECFEDNHSKINCWEWFCRMKFSYHLQSASEAFVQCTIINVFISEHSCCYTNPRIYVWTSNKS